MRALLNSPLLPLVLSLSSLAFSGCAHAPVNPCPPPLRVVAPLPPLGPPPEPGWFQEAWVLLEPYLIPVSSAIGSTVPNR